MSWILFALASYFLVAVSDIIDKVLRDKLIKNSYAISILNGFLNLALAAVLVLLNPIKIPSNFDIVLLLASGVVSIAGVVAYFQALASSEASRVVPLFQFIAIFTLILSFIFLGENLTAIQFLGFAFVVAGGFLISKKSKGIFSLDKSFWYMMLSCFFYAVSFILIKSSLQRIDFYSAQTFISAGFFVGALLLIPYSFYFRKVSFSDLNFKLPVVGLQSINQAIYVAGRLLLNIAFTLAPVALVTALESFVGFFVLILATILSLLFPKILKEDTSKSALGLKIVAIALMFIGVWIIT